MNAEETGNEASRRKRRGIFYLQGKNILYAPAYPRQAAVNALANRFKEPDGMNQPWIFGRCGRPEGVEEPLKIK